MMQTSKQVDQPARKRRVPLRWWWPRGAMAAPEGWRGGPHARPLPHSRSRSPLVARKDLTALKYR